MLQQEMKLQDLKAKSPVELLSYAEEVQVENASAMLNTATWYFTCPPYNLNVRAGTRGGHPR